MTSELDKIVKILKKAVKAKHSFELVKSKISEVESAAVFMKDNIGNVQGITIEVFDKKLFYFENAINRGSLTNLQKSLNKKYCPPPFYLVGEGWFIEKYHSTKNQKEFEELIFSIFTPLSMATIYNQIFCASPTLSKHKSTIFESMEAYWLGMDYISTDSLVTVLEGALRDLIHSSGKERPSLKFQKHIRSLAIDRLKEKFDQLEGFYWYPFKTNNFKHALANRGTDEELKLWVHLDHTMDAINAFLIWFTDVLYKEHPSDSNEFTLNRPNMIHGFSERKAVPVYYPLMLWSLLSLIYIESLFIKPRSCFFPEANERDRDLSKYFDTLVGEPAEGRRALAKGYGVTYKYT